ncbi:MAG TPA: hypothetical protein DDW49_11280 [Deltaproteobacteria bacterium]|nr:hypothetical protein [Deltaproteobacteria bacterium]
MSFLQDYLDASGNVVLNDNQVIVLVESGVDMNRNPGSPAADFQDAVLLITISPVTGGGDTSAHRCNQGIGNGSEGCDPGNSTNDQHDSNDEP